jgi:hypothetical protein
VKGFILSALLGIWITATSLFWMWLAAGLMIGVAMAGSQAPSWSALIFLLVVFLLFVGWFLGTAWLVKKMFTDWPEHDAQ